MKRSKNESGSVLVLVIVLLAVMLLMATSFIATVNTHRFSSRNMRAYTMLQILKIPDCSLCNSDPDHQNHPDLPDLKYGEIVVVDPATGEPIYQYDKKWRKETHLFYTAVSIGGDEKPDFQAHYKVEKFIDSPPIYEQAYDKSGYAINTYLRMTNMDGSMVIAHTPTP
jgi:hypothetical protein